MGSWKAALPGKYLKKEDVGEEGKTLTISSFEPRLIEGDQCAVVGFSETEQELVMNKVNGNRIEHVCGTEDTDQWVGKKVHFYSDPTVEFGGKIVGGIRVDINKSMAANTDPAAGESEVPF